MPQGPKRSLLQFFAIVCLPPLIAAAICVIDFHQRTELFFEVYLIRAPFVYRILALTIGIGILVCFVIGVQDEYESIRWRDKEDLKGRLLVSAMAGTAIGFFFGTPAVFLILLIAGYPMDKESISN